jgi:hypothetical protein
MLYDDISQTSFIEIVFDAVSFQWFTNNLPNVLPGGNEVHVDSTASSDCRRV